MPGVSGDNLSDFNNGDPLSARKFQALVSALRRQTMQPGSFQTGAFNVQRPVGTPGDTTTTDGHDGFIVLIDKDIDPIKEADPNNLLETADVPLTEDEVAAGYTTVFQNPVPDDNNYDDNHVDNLNLWPFKATKLTLKEIVSDGTSITGTAQSGTTTSIVLAAGSSTVDGFHDGDTIEITGGTGEGQTRTIGSYDGDTLTATVDEDWDTAPDNTSEYAITSDANFRQAYSVIDDPDHMEGDTPAPRKIVRYQTQEVWYLDGQGLIREDYKRIDYKDTYPEDEAFPPDGTGTYEEPPDGFLKKRYRAQAKYAAGRYWLDFETCKAIKPSAFTVRA